MNPPRPDAREGRPAGLARAAFPILLGALYLVVLLLPFRVYAPRFSTHLIGDHPDALLQHLHCAWQWQALAEGRWAEILRLPTMFPYASGLAFGEPLVGATLPFAAVYAWTGSTPAAYNGAVVASFPLLGLATFLWVRELFASRAAGLLAAVLVVMSPWRLHFLTALNLLTLHYAVFALWLLGRWLRRASLAPLLAAALCLHVQLVTAAQGALVAGALALVWAGAVWLRAGLRVRRERVVQGALALALFAALALPWAAFFGEAFEAARGLPRTDAMQRFSLPFAQMAERFGVFGAPGILAALGAPAAWLAIRAGRLPRGVGTDLIALALGAGLLFVVALGPYRGPATDPVALPGFLALEWIPGLELFRAPIRLAAMTPVILALLAGGAMAWLEQRLRAHLPGHAGTLCALLPLALALGWPPLGAAMGAPIAARAEDRALAEALRALPEGAVILPLPLDLEPSGAAVDERVLIHRRRQVGGFASIMPPLFPQLANLLGQWPFDGDGVAQRVGATHLVVPEGWLVRGGERAARDGYELLASAGGRSILRVPPRPEPAGSLRLRAPALAAAGRWLTLSLAASEPTLFLRGHEALAAEWSAGGRSERVSALALYPGLAGPEAPILIYVPTPKAPGRHALRVDFPAQPLAAELEIRRIPTTADAPIRAASLALAPGYRAPDAIRAGRSFRVAVRVEATAGPILLASSRERLPDRRGETLVVYQFRAQGAARGAGATAQAGLSGDLAPGEAALQTWHLSAPAKPGRYDLLVRLAARGGAAMPMPWTPLLRDLLVTID